MQKDGRPNSMLDTGKANLFKLVDLGTFNPLFFSFYVKFISFFLLQIAADVNVEQFLKEIITILTIFQTN